MRCTVTITDSRDEEIIIFAHKRNSLTDEIEALARDDGEEFIGYTDRGMKKLSPTDINVFTVKENKIYALTSSGEYLIRSRLCSVEERLGKGFIRINQSSIANIRKIERFEASIGGAICIVFKNGYKDYVSRRQMKAVKLALGI